MYCRHCGKQELPDSKFCRGCGSEMHATGDLIFGTTANARQVEPLDAPGTRRINSDTDKILKDAQQSRPAPLSNHKTVGERAEEFSRAVALFALIAAVGGLVFLGLLARNQSLTTENDVNLNANLGGSQPASMHTAEFETFAVSQLKHTEIICNQIFLLPFPEQQQVIPFVVDGNKGSANLVGGYKAMNLDTFDFFVLSADLYDDGNTVPNSSPYTSFIHAEQTRSRRINKPISPGRYYVVISSFTPNQIAAELKVEYY